jgi:hypothetical protein
MAWNFEEKPRMSAATNQPPINHWPLPTATVTPVVAYCSSRDVPAI